MEKIILIGYMGSGKSTIAKLLSKSINYEFLDLDEIIEKEQNASVSRIFEQKGEVFFRKLEHQVLKRILQSESNMILSLGGGTPCFTNNQELLKQESPFATIFENTLAGVLNALGGVKGPKLRAHSRILNKIDLAASKGEHFIDLEASEVDFLKDVFLNESDALVIRSEHVRPFSVYRDELERALAEKDAA